MKNTLIFSLCAAGMLSFSVSAATGVEVKAGAVKAEAGVSLKNGVEAKMGTTPGVQVESGVSLKKGIHTTVKLNGPKVDPFSVLPQNVAVMNGKNVTRDEFKSFLLSNSPEGKLPEQLNAEYMKTHAYDLINWYVMDKLVDQAQAKANINLTPDQIKKLLKEQFAKMPANLREMMTKQLDMKGMTIDKYIDQVAADPQMRKQVNREKFIESIVKNVKIKDADVKNFYKDHKEKEFMTPADGADTMRASHILIGVDKKSDGKKELAKANELCAQLKKDPAAFGKLAYENSACPSGKQANGSLGAFQKGMMVPEFEKAVQALKPGQISGPVKTQFGYHIIRRDMPQKAQVIEFKTVEPAIRQMLENRAKGEAWQKYVDSLMKSAGVKILVPAPKSAPAAK